MAAVSNPKPLKSALAAQAAMAARRSMLWMQGRGPGWPGKLLETALLVPQPLSLGRRQ